MTRDPENTEYGRCEATNRQGKRCGRAAIGEHGKCGYHGGKTPTVHGLRSPYLSAEDREIYDDVREFDEVEHLREEFWMTKTKLLRAAKATEGNEGVGMARDLIEKVENGQADDEVVDALAGLLRVSNATVDRAIGRLIDLAKEIRKHENADTIQMEHSGSIDGKRTLGDNEKSMLRNALDPD